eukprot:6400513-Amphidinium_carterae.1
MNFLECSWAQERKKGAHLLQERPDSGGGRGRLSKAAPRRSPSGLRRRGCSRGHVGAPAPR